MAVPKPTRGCEYRPVEAKMELPALSHNHPSRSAGIKTTYSRDERSIAYSRQDQFPDTRLFMTADDIKNPLRTKKTITASCPNPEKK
jgi:hypothetical protein